MSLWKALWCEKCVLCWAEMSIHLFHLSDKQQAVNSSKPYAQWTCMKEVVIVRYVALCHWIRLWIIFCLHEKNWKCSKLYNSTFSSFDTKITFCSFGFSHNDFFRLSVRLRYLNMFANKKKDLRSLNHWTTCYQRHLCNGIVFVLLCVKRFQIIRRVRFTITLTSF